MERHSKDQLRELRYIEFCENKYPANVYHMPQPLTQQMVNDGLVEEFTWQGLWTGYRLTSKGRKALHRDVATVVYLTK